VELVKLDRLDELGKLDVIQKEVFLKNPGT